jgi:hypothetical protein
MAGGMRRSQETGNLLTAFSVSFQHAASMAFRLD